MESRCEIAPSRVFGTSGQSRFAGAWVILALAYPTKTGCLELFLGERGNSGAHDRAYVCERIIDALMDGLGDRKGIGPVRAKVGRSLFLCAITGHRSPITQKWR
jgi:hypothetical protein